MSTVDLPEWLVSWCLEHMGSEPVGELLRIQRISTVYGLQLADGSEIVVKVRENEGRTASCVAAQAQLAIRGFPCASSLTPVFVFDSRAVHAEQYRPGGDMLHGDTPEIAALYARVFAHLMAELEEVTVSPPLPNPRWARWDHTGTGIWPVIDFLDEHDQRRVPTYIADTAQRVRERLLAVDRPCVLGHGDFEAQNLRWHGNELWTVHDWDSLAWQPEAALVGAACGTFANTGPSTLAPIENSEAFLEAYQERRGRAFTKTELEAAWAASLWPAAHNARWESLHGTRPLSANALREQAPQRLSRVCA